MLLHFKIRSRTCSCIIADDKQVLPTASLVMTSRLCLSYSKGCGQPSRPSHMCSHMCSTAWHGTGLCCSGQLQRGSLSPPRAMACQVEDPRRVIVYVVAQWSVVAACGIKVLAGCVHLMKSLFCLFAFSLSVFSSLAGWLALLACCNSDQRTEDCIFQQHTLQKSLKSC